MIKIEFIPKLKDFFTSTQTIKVLAFLGFTILLTSVIASQNFFFQNIIENGISKRDIIAQKTLVVEDVKSQATKTQVYKLKKKLFEQKYGIEIKEV